MDQKRQQVADALLHGLTDALRKEREEALAELKAHNGKNLAFYHSFGKRIASIRANPGKYGGNVFVAGKTYEPVERLACTLGSSQQIVYKSLRFYEVYPSDKDVARLAAISVKGKPLTWSAVIQLCSIQDAADRERFEKRIQSEGLEDANDIKYELQKQQGKLRSGGRPVAVPSNAKQGLRQATACVETFKKKCEEAFFGERFDLVAQIVDEVASLDETDLESVEELGDLQLQLGAFLQRNGQLLKTKAAQLSASGACRKAPLSVAR